MATKHGKTSNQLTVVVGPKAEVSIIYVVVGPKAEVSIIYVVVGPKAEVSIIYGLGKRTTERLARAEYDRLHGAAVGKAGRRR